MSGCLLKLIRESVGLTQARLAEQLGMDVTSVQGWESGRRPLAALRAVDLLWLRLRLLQSRAQPTSLVTLDHAIQADLIIAETLQAGSHVVKADGQPLAATVHQRSLSDLITWPLTGIAPTPLQALVSARPRRGPAPERPTLTESELTRFYDHLLVTAEANPDECTELARRQAIYLLGFDTRASTVQWLHVEQRHALQNARSTDHIPSWVRVRSSAVALAQGGNRDPLRAFLQHALATDQLEQANLNYWAYWVGEIDAIQVNDDFMGRVDPQSWRGARLLDHLLELLHPGSAQAELNLHTVWALLLTHPTLLSNHRQLRSATASKIEELATDQDLSRKAQHELSEIAYAVRLAHR